jgi:tRNA1Val (adenine37-N6)-methyltransferase
MPDRDPGAPVTTDTLLLASCVSVPRGSTVIELGCGSGGVIEAASRENPGCRWIGVDARTPPLREMMGSPERRSAADEVHCVCCNVEDVPMAFSEAVADLVITNPPFGTLGRGRVSPDRDRALSRSGSDMLLHHFIRAAAHVLPPGGEFIVVGRPCMLPEMLLGCSSWGLGPVRLQPVGQPDRPAVHILLRCVKGSGAELVIHHQKTAEDVIHGVDR